MYISVHTKHASCGIIIPIVQFEGAPENTKATSQYAVVELKSIEELKKEQHHHQLLTRSGSVPVTSNDVVVSERITIYTLYLASYPGS